MLKKLANSNFIRSLKPYQEWLWVGIFIQALVAMVGSLYYSSFGDPVENFMSGNPFPAGGGFTPCLLCWFARILMYPIVAISYVGMAKRDKRFTDYVLPLSLLGVLLDTYHYALQLFPIHSIFGCSLENPCSALQVGYFGFITIPFLALVAFLVISVLGVLNMLINLSADKKPSVAAVIATRATKSETQRKIIKRKAK